MQRAGSPLRGLASWSLAAAALLAACGGAAVGESPPLSGDDALAAEASVTNTLDGVGALPATDLPVEFPTALFDDEILVDVSLPALETEQIGLTAAGNRVLLVGDSLFAGLAPRYSNLACQGLTPLGWQVLVEAEPGRFAEFGTTVLNRRLDDGWDAVVLNFGTNYRGDRDAYTKTMADMLTDIGDVPVVLLNTTMFRAQQREVNEAIAGLGNLFPNVTVVDWETLSTVPGLMSSDRIHPTDNGRKIMVAAIAQVLGTAPSDPATPASCLRSTFTDDSAVGRGSLSIATSIPSGRGSGGSGSGGVTTTTTPRNSSTTLPSGATPPGSTPTGTSPPGGTTPTTAPTGGTPTTSPTGSTPTGSTPTGSTPTGSTPSATSSPATSPPATSPPATSPPATSPPATSPPATSPPATSPPVSEQSQSD